MGELALRLIQAGVETVPGTAVAATRKLYGTLEPKRDQPRRWAMEERGVLVSNFRGNAKLVDATFKLKGDVMFEDLPFYLEVMNKGGVSPVGTAAVGYTYDYTPAITPADLASNPLKSLTLEWGDESLQWQAPFAQADNLKVEIGTDDPIQMEIDGFTQEWWPRERNGFTGFTADIDEHAVEAPNGWQVRLFVDKFDPFDLSHDAMGTTYVPTRFIKATAEYKNQNKRKYFGDFAPFFEKIGRGRREVSLAISLEEQASADYTAGLGGLGEIGDMVDTNQPNFRVPQTRVRLQAVGSQIDTSSFGTLNGPIAPRGTATAQLNGAKVAGTYTSATIDASTYQIGKGSRLRILNDIVTLTASLAVGGTSIAFSSITITGWGDNTPVYVESIGSIVTNALTEVVPAGAALVLGDHGQIVTVDVAQANAAHSGAGLEVGDTNIPIVKFVPRNGIATSANIYRAKSIEFDFYGALEGDVKWASHETNVAYDLVVMGVFDIDAAKQDAIFVTNDLATATDTDATTPGGTPPSAPTAVAENPSTRVVTWTDGAANDFPIDGFQLRSTNTGDATLMYRSADADDVSLLFTGLTLGQDYTFAVRAHSAAGFGAWSAESTHQTQT